MNTQTDLLPAKSFVEVKAVCTQEPGVGVLHGSAGSILADIHPSKGERYSANLHRWLSSARRWKDYAKVYTDHEGTLWIGMMDGGWLHGTRLMRVLCVGRKAEIFAFGHLKLKEVENFWSEYLRVGRCAIDRAHNIAFLNADSRFTEDGDVRSCIWCGHRQRRERLAENVRCERWISQQNVSADLKIFPTSSSNEVLLMVGTATRAGVSGRGARPHKSAFCGSP